MRAQNKPLKPGKPPVGTVNAEQLIVIVHGTWAHFLDKIWWEQKSGWYEWPETFPAYLDNESNGAVYKEIAGSPPPFEWSGRNDHDERILAANELKVWIDDVMDPKDKRKLTIVAHSHGGNVALFAAFRHDLHIDKLILLGTPIRTEYPVKLVNVGEIWNVYSVGDRVQKPGGWPNSRGEARTLPDSDKIVNVVLEKNPGHSALHDANVWQSHHIGSLVK